ncbi:hypothetical protein, conserved [Entamoeba dispar SAW760]|uniref:Leucine rich repeat containing protein BspA family protein n=1 Tax=Entamoeba dispar (strain ATCC PRA-260 / SAW760) TaxID=370354 RepID=B0EM73_ENTDS|nr:uncharacterized protein EDI_043610 [Entamoeba dispar SAW760]EDR24372.1 hypothetical protein, conserved [Entamoeba dispar SAW760]|eukprot:EDR24372.1 hypothetical protein, conserved [Entamoeba dispar SAW760]
MFIININYYPSSISELGRGKFCFDECESLTSINIPSSISKLGKCCFRRCPSLKSINIPTSITSIGIECFKECYSLTSINIPSSITSFEYGCFYECGCEEELMKNKRIPKYCFEY